jgi:hypothetical protein
MNKLLTVLLLFVSSLTFANEVLFRLEMKKEFLDKISINKKYVLHKYQGKDCLYLKSGKVFVFSLPEDLAQFEGEYLRVTYRYSLKNVPKPAKPHLGFKIMSSYKCDGKVHCGHTPSPFGTKNWTWDGFNFLVKKNAKEFKLSIVLPKGEAYISDLTVSFMNKGKK